LYSRIVEHNSFIVLYKKEILTMAKSVPQRRNGIAGTYIGKSRSSKYFATHPEARKKKNVYNTKYHETENRKRYRAELNSYNDKHNGNGDASHTKNGNIVRESPRTNRARNGKNGKSSKK